jgi:hypothetical protein
MTPQPPERTPPAHLTARPILRVATPEQKGETVPLGPVLFSYTTRKPLGVAAPSSFGIHRSCSRQLQPKWKTQGFANADRLSGKEGMAALIQRKPIELPPEVARRFVEDMRAYLRAERPQARRDRSATAFSFAELSGVRARKSSRSPR